MKTLLQSLPFITFLMFFFAACEKDSDNENLVPDEPQDTIVWEPVNQINPEVITNLFVDGGELKVLTKNFYYQLNLNDFSAESHYVGNFSESWATVLNDELFVKIESSWIFVFNANNPEKYTGIDLHDHLDDFGKFFFPSAWLGNVIAINENNVFLTVYRPLLDGVFAAEPRLLLFSAELDAEGNVSVENIISSSIDEGYVFGDLSGVYTCGEDFIISLNPYTYKVTSQGEWTRVFDGRIFNFIPWDGKLLGFGDDDLLISDDGGESWEPLSYNLPPGYRPWQHKGFVHDNQLLIWDTYTISLLDLSGSEGHLKTFCNEGLEPGPGKYIHRIVLTEEYAFVGTGQGLYYKPLEDFLESKIDN
ncbi:MAG: hypothetical protein EA361_14310 [Bacteroidetes bacterium]|nr:MAG: hypothetical protein EA361_14310 [Bacteroidota bacterium]